MLDRRLHAFRPDLADLALKGQVEADRFVSSEPAVINRPVVALRPKPDLTIGIDTELLMGEEVPPRRSFIEHHALSVKNLDV